MKVNEDKTVFFATIATYEDGRTVEDSFTTLHNAKLYRDEVLMKEDGIKEVEVVERLQKPDLIRIITSEDLNQDEK